MSTLEISIARDPSGVDVVIIRDREMREVARVEALSPGHARSMASDCALMIVRTGGGSVVLL
jgi:hypothetical protein